MRYFRVSLELLGALGILTLIGWGSLSSSMFVSIHDYEYIPKEGVIEWQRTQRFGPHWIEWSIEARASDGLECYATGHAHMQTTNEVVPIPIPQSLQPCFESGRVVVLTHRFQVALFDWLPLRPIRFVEVVR